MVEGGLNPPPQPVIPVIGRDKAGVAIQAETLGLQSHQPQELVGGFLQGVQAGHVQVAGPGRVAVHPFRPRPVGGCQAAGAFMAPGGVHIDHDNARGGVRAQEDVKFARLFPRAGAVHGHVQEMRAQCVVHHGGLDQPAGGRAQHDGIEARVTGQRGHGVAGVGCNGNAGQAGGKGQYVPRVNRYDEQIKPAAQRQYGPQCKRAEMLPRPGPRLHH